MLSDVQYCYAELWKNYKKSRVFFQAVNDNIFIIIIYHIFRNVNMHISMEY